jgi:hypothetical protein
VSGRSLVLTTSNTTCRTSPGCTPTTGVNGRNRHASLRTLESSSMRTSREVSTCVLDTSSGPAISRSPVTSQIFS